MTPPSPHRPHTHTHTHASQAHETQDAIGSIKQSFTQKLAAIAAAAAKKLTRN